MRLGDLLHARNISHQALRFLAGGAANTLLSYLIYWLLLAWLPYPVAYTASYAVAILSGFAINTFFVFRVPWSWPRLAAFPLVHLINYGASMSVVAISVQLLGITPYLAPVLATLTTLPLNFFLTRKLLHRD